MDLIQQEGDRPCPLCRKPARAEFSPFCSKACKDRDLLRWLDEGYRIPGPVAVIVCGAAAAAVSLPGWGADRLRIGLTPVILADQVAFLSRWSRYLGARLGVEVEFVARESYQSVLDLLFSDQVDAAWICGYPYIRYEADLSLLAVP